MFSACRLCWCCLYLRLNFHFFKTTFEIICFLSHLKDLMKAAVRTPRRKIHHILAISSWRTRRKRSQSRFIIPCRPSAAPALSSRDRRLELLPDELQASPEGVGDAVPRPGIVEVDGLDDTPRSRREKHTCISKVLVNPANSRRQSLRTIRLFSCYSIDVRITAFANRFRSPQPSPSQCD